MDLVKLERPIPIKAIPEAELNKIILMDFTPWVAGLLSLTGETSMNRLEIALPAIKKHCWSMGFNEIKKMFEMFADGELSVQPKSNYFDRVLLSQIVQAYRMTQRSRSKPKEIAEPELSNEEKELAFINLVVTCFDEYKQTKKITFGITPLYDHFYAQNKFPVHSHEFREKVRERALKRLKKQQNNSLARRTVPNYSEAMIALTCKEIILTDWFNELIKENKQIENEI